MRRYEEAELEIIAFDTEDVITASCTGDVNAGDDCTTDFNG